MFRSRILTAILCALALPVSAFAQGSSAPADILPFKASEKTLGNGLKVIVVPTGFPNIVSLQIPMQTGSRNEVEPGKSGFAHFFEHMMFRGTKAYPPDVYNAIITKAGARQNAYTLGRPDELPHHLRQGRSGKDPGDRGRPFQEPLVRRRRLQNRGAGGAG